MEPKHPVKTKGTKEKTQAEKFKRLEEINPAVRKLAEIFDCVIQL